jgi:hypothetical protein
LSSGVAILFFPEMRERRLMALVIHDTRQRSGIMIKQAPKDKPSPHQGIVLDERGQEQPADKERAQHVSQKNQDDDPTKQK